MLATLRQCPVAREVTLDEEFTKDISLFHKYLAGTNGVFKITQDTRRPLHIYINTCMTSYGTLCQADAYNTEFSIAIVQENHPICKLEAVNIVVALKCWTSQLQGEKVVLQIDSAIAAAAAVFQARRGRDAFI